MLKIYIMGGVRFWHQHLREPGRNMLLGYYGMSPLKELPALAEERCASSFRTWESKKPCNGLLDIPEDLNRRVTLWGCVRTELHSTDHL